MLRSGARPHDLFEYIRAWRTALLAQLAVFVRVENRRRSRYAHLRHQPQVTVELLLDCVWNFLQPLQLAGLAGGLMLMQRRLLILGIEQGGSLLDAEIGRA